MLARLATVWDRLSTSLWALPIAIVIAAAILAIVAVSVNLDPQTDTVWWLYSGGADAASGFLASLLTAMITMATLAISITMVVLTLAARSLGSRLISIFMGDTYTKLALGLFIGTVVYLLIVLRTVVGAEEAPNIAVTIGTLLALTCMVVLLFFVHLLARSSVSDTIIERVGYALDHHARRLLPESGAEADPTAPSVSEIEATGRAFYASAGGYVQAIDHPSAVSAASQAGAVVAHAFRPGQFVIAGDVLGWITPPAAASDKLIRSVEETIVCGRERTSVQDIEYAVRQLVEIALRALSSGVNDPYTALAVIDRAASSIALIMARGPIPTVWRDDEGNVRLVVPTTTFRGILDAAFDQIRQSGAAMPAVVIRMADRLAQLLNHADDDEAREIVHHLELVREAGLRAIPDEADRRDLQTRVSAALASRKSLSPA